MADSTLIEKEEQDLEKEEHDKGILEPQEASQHNPHEIQALVKLAKADYNNDNYKEAIESSQKILEIDPANVEALHILSYIYYYTNEDDKAIDYCTQWIASDIQNPAIPLAILNKIYEKKARQEAKRAWEEARARLIEQAKVEERNKVIADLSHSIKNLISTVIDPLENLKQEAGKERQIIENALRGANLVRETVNAMNLSSKGSLEDFSYDAKHNTGNNSFDVKTMLIESLKYSVGNMFDGKYFSNFMRKYFPTKDLYVEAKSKWDQISQANELNVMVPFLQKYFFETDIVWGDAESFVMGNERGSAIKLLILFQEIILNAVKYSVFIPKKKRFLKVYFSSNNNQISIKVENRFKPDVKTKTSGLGHVIIENFTKLMNTIPIINKDKDVYSVEITFENFWKRIPG